MNGNLKCQNHTFACGSGPPNLTIMINHNDFFFWYSKDVGSLLAKHIGMFSYGSGLASSMFSFTVTGDASRLESLISPIKDVANRLESRISIAPKDFVDMLKLKEETHHQGHFTRRIL